MDSSHSPIAAAPASAPHSVSLDIPNGTSKQLPASLQVQASTQPPVSAQVPSTQLRSISHVVRRDTPSKSTTLASDLPADRDWHRGLFQCFQLPVENWCTGLWCPCMTFGEVRYRTKYPDDAELSNFNAVCNLDCWSFYCLAYWTGCGHNVWGTLNRHELRHGLNIRGKSFGDCLTHFFCSNCALCQELEQVKRDREPLLQQYVLQRQMAYEKPATRATTTKL